MSDISKANDATLWDEHRQDTVVWILRGGVRLMERKQRPRDMSKWYIRKTTPFGGPTRWFVYPPGSWVNIRTFDTGARAFENLESLGRRYRRWT